MPVSPVKLTEKLHLVVPLYRTTFSEGKEQLDTVYAYVHAAPVSREIFEAHYLLLARTFTEIHTAGLAEIAGPRIAAMMMRDVARKLGDEQGHRALMNEIRRLSNARVQTESGWEVMPFEDALNHLDPDDASEAENAIVFFIAVSAMHRKTVTPGYLRGAAALWGAETTFSDFTAWNASQETSTAGARSASKKAAIASSIPR